MRLLRAITAVLGAVALGAVALPGQAGAAPAAPYDFFSLYGRQSLAYDPSNATFGINQYTLNNGGEAMYFYATTGTNTAMIELEAPGGVKFTPGTYTTNPGGHNNTWGMRVSVDHTSCDGFPGTVTIRSVTRDGAGKLASLALFYENCGDHGEVRWHSADGYVEALPDTREVMWQAQGMGQRSESKTVTITSLGSEPLRPGAAGVTGPAAGSFPVESNGCAGKTLTYGQTCTVTVGFLPQAQGHLDATLTVADNTAPGGTTVKLRAMGEKTAAGNFFPVGPIRILDTRNGTGGRSVPLGPKQTLSLQVAGVANVPATNVSAVVLNVTAALPSAASYLTAYPSGTVRPTASNLNFTAGWVGANSVTVPLGANGKVDIYNEAGTVSVIADVLGYYMGWDTYEYRPSDMVGSQYQPHATTRVVDTRDPDWGALPGGYSLPVVVDYGAAIRGRVKALAVNITAVVPQRHGYLTAYTGIGEPPLASTLNFSPGAVVPNFAIVPATSCNIVPECWGMAQIEIYNGSTGAVHVLVDVVGFFDDSFIGPGMRFHPLTPTRITDTRTMLGGSGTLGPNTTATFTAPPPAAVDETWALVANLTGVNTGGAGTYLTAWESGENRPPSSNLNLMPHEVRPNAAFVPLGPGNKYNVYNAASTTDVIVDVAGRFDYYPYPMTGAVTATGRQPAAVPVPRLLQQFGYQKI